MEYFSDRSILPLQADILALFLCFYSAQCFIIRENQLTLQTIYAYQYDIN